MTTTIGAHQHFWEPSRPFDYRWLDAPALSKIRRDFLPEDLAPLIRAEGVDPTVFVQTQHNLEENRWILDLAERHPFVAGVVGWGDLASEDVESQILEFRASPKFVGVRHVVQDEPERGAIGYLRRDDEPILRAGSLSIARSSAERS